MSQSDWRGEAAAAQCDRWVSGFGVLPSECWVPQCGVLRCSLVDSAQSLATLRLLLVCVVLLVRSSVCRFLFGPPRETVAVASLLVVCVVPCRCAWPLVRVCCGEGRPSRSKPARCSKALREVRRGEEACERLSPSTTHRTVLQSMRAASPELEAGTAKATDSHTRGQQQQEEGRNHEQANTRTPAGRRQ